MIGLADHKIRTSPQGRHNPARIRGAILYNHANRNVAQIQGYTPSEKEKQNVRQHKGNDQTAGITENLVTFFSGKGQYTAEPNSVPHLPGSLSSLSF
jgi:hypothetical protein